MLGQALLHGLLLHLGHDYDGAAPLRRVCIAELVHDGQQLVTPAQDEGVPCLQHVRLAFAQVLHPLPNRVCIVKVADWSAMPFLAIFVYAARLQEGLQDKCSQTITNALPVAKMVVNVN